jgi:hypothetical protein
MSTNTWLSGWRIAKVHVFLCVGFLATTVSAQDDTNKIPAIIKNKERLKVPEGVDQFQKILIARYNEILAEVHIRYEELLVGTRLDIDGSGPLLDAAQRLLRVGIELHPRPAGQVALVNQLLELGRQVERILDARVKVGAGEPAQLARARDFCLDMEYRLEWLKKAGAGPVK